MLIRHLPIVALAAAALALPGTAPAAPGAARALPILYAKTGPGFVITLKNASGRAVRRVEAGTYQIVVRDRSGDDAHNFHLVGPGLDVGTGVGFVGTKRWRVTFRKGKVYRFRCDPHALVMHGSFRAV